ncbi:CocE/NonD family hydrolase [Sediminicola luteus]|uniref:X-Pro dipeptidyl-peptidase n=1 Tax=Sediminicola luteus TaxID=319238 RepID=A0A2A4G7U0_9FLAO|nr:CocE/NonD family hydrolase [Sediminicola luteus]PCE64056.1 X-Pro dipeptidyl-peptidase [Sediminicola luteus]
MRKLLFAFTLGLLFSCSQAQTDYDPKAHYNKSEVTISMRDGIKLHTTIYSPKDTSKEYPILLHRTPYSCRPYGEAYRSKIGPNNTMMKEGNIVVYQDVRGRWNSEGVYDNMRAYIPNKKRKEVDEASDTYDTIDWLVKNIANNNGKVGVWGISYPGFYSTYALLDAHPALKAVSPQAPIGDFYFDDFHHNGAYLLSYWRATAVFGYMKDQPTTEAWYKFPELGTEDQYQFFLDAGPLSNLDQYYKEDNVFWTQLKEHPDYDEFWQKRGIIQHLNDIKPAVMTVGGWFDAEDLYGPLNTYGAIEKSSKTYNTLVMGPWSHGDWARNKKRQAVGNVYFGDDLSKFFQEDIETEFFNHFLKGSADGNTGLPEAYLFDTGTKDWHRFENWPPRNLEKRSYFLQAHERLSPIATREYSAATFVSDPAKPVPYSEDIKMVFTPRKFMTDDQRFAARRPDVLVFETPVLEEAVTLAGPLLAKLKVATTGTDADWVVKLIDVYPPDHEDYEETQDHLKMGNYHQMVRSEVIRGRYRNDFAKPEPFEPNKETAVDLTLQDVLHTFKKGHKIQVQIQSTWFPYIDRNPQNYVDNIFLAKESDFGKQTHSVYNSSKIEVGILPTKK